MLSTKRLAYGWLYGDLVHADATERLAVEEPEYDLTYRYLVPWGCRAMKTQSGALGLVPTSLKENRIIPKQYTPELRLGKLTPVEFEMIYTAATAA